MNQSGDSNQQEEINPGGNFREIKWKHLLSEVGHGNMILTIIDGKLFVRKQCIKRPSKYGAFDVIIKEHMRIVY